MQNCDKFKQIVDDSGVGCRIYSGRSMYGVKCLGIVTSDLGETISELILSAISLNDSDSQSHSEALAETMRDMRWDSMGRDFIIYFPTVEWQPQWVEDNDNE